MTFDNLITAFSFIGTAIAIYFSTRKQSSEVKNVDADTIAKMFANLKEQQAEYEELKLQFTTYKTNMDAQFAALASENVKLRAWARRLVRQLELAGCTTPVPFEE